MAIWEQSELQEAVKKIAPDVYHSMYEGIPNSGSMIKGDWKVKAPKLSELYMTGRVRFIRYEGWKSEVFENPTYADVMRAMQASIEALDDFHHVFLEKLLPNGIEVSGTCDQCGRGPREDELPITLVELLTGS